MSATDFVINLGLLGIAASVAAALAYRVFYGLWPWHDHRDGEDDQ